MKFLQPSTATFTKPNSDVDDIRFGEVIRSVSEIPPAGGKPRIALLGVPHHKGVQRNGGRIGAASAPDALRTALYKLTTFNGKHSLAPCEILDYGNLDCSADSLESIQEQQQEIVYALLQHHNAVLVFGGGHDIAFPNGMALAKSTRSMGMMNFDAHLDVRQHTSEGSHSGSPFRDILENANGKIPAGAFVEFGIQPFSAAEHHARYIIEKGHSIAWLDEIRHVGFAAALETALSAISATTERCYASFDIDGIASAFAPGVSAPASDGFSAQEIILAAAQVGALTSCTLVDIVEMNPLYDVDNRTAKLCATMCATFISTRVETLQ